MDKNQPKIFFSRLIEGLGSFVVDSNRETFMKIGSRSGHTKWILFEFGHAFVIDKIYVSLINDGKGKNYINHLI